MSEQQPREHKSRKLKVSANAPQLTNFGSIAPPSGMLPTSAAPSAPAVLTSAQPIPMAAEPSVEQPEEVPYVKPKRVRNAPPKRARNEEEESSDEETPPDNSPLVDRAGNSSAQPEKKKWVAVEYPDNDARNPKLFNTVFSGFREQIKQAVKPVQAGKPDACYVEAVGKVRAAVTGVQVGVQKSFKDAWDGVTWETVGTYTIGLDPRWPAQFGLVNAKGFGTVNIAKAHQAPDTKTAMAGNPEYMVNPTKGKPAKEKAPKRPKPDAPPAPADASPLA